MAFDRIMTSHIRFFVGQTWALTKKNLLVAVVGHWFSAFLCATVLPIAFMVLLSNINNFLIAQNGFGVGSPLPAQSLANNLPGYQKLVFVQPLGLGLDVAKVVKAVASPLRGNKNLIFSLTRMIFFTPVRRA